MPPDTDQGNARRQRRRSSRGLNDSLSTHCNLYELLALPKTATDEDIKRAYRRMALKYHPDKNRNDPEASKKFQDINYANAVLSNPTKRQIYDRYGEMGLKMMQQFGEENMSLALRPWLKWLICIIAVLTCGCFCCCCCCFGCFKCCCNFCFGACKPEDASNADFSPFDAFDDVESQPVRAQPAGSGTSEATQFTTAAATITSSSVRIDMECHPPPVADHKTCVARNEPPPPYSAPPPPYTADSPITAPAPSYGAMSAKE
ncbi:hypothetical protein niasHS_009156 [Heterodera schachtii]|uniref:J domain-containing protein n=1 Tax=Heterodera schachtii TaxID=97005 RepID=A0ABD2JE09_HETSC